MYDKFGYTQVRQNALSMQGSTQDKRTEKKCHQYKYEYIYIEVKNRINICIGLCK